MLEDPRPFFIFLLLAFPAVGAVNSIVHGLQLKKFVDQTPIFDTYQKIIEFEQVVKRQMHGALLQIVLLATPGIVFVIGIVLKALSVGDVAFVILPSFVILALGIAFKSIEARAKAIPADDPVVAERRDHIVSTWMSKALPDW